MKADFLLRSAGRLVTCAGAGDGPLGVIENGAVLGAGGQVVWVGREADLPQFDADGELVEIDAEGRAVLPGLVECHTHLVFAGDRTREFAARMRGERYTSGGIRTTVAATREADDDELVSLAMDRLDRFLSFGVTTLEAKTGYGLSVTDELRLADITRRLQHPVEVIPTLLAAHVVPDEFKADADSYVDIVCNDIIPGAVGMRFCDAWCDEGAFTVEQCRRVLEVGRRARLEPKLHAEQLSHSGGAQLAAELRATSADHLEHASQEDAAALAGGNVVAVLLPGASSMTRSRYADARMLLDGGVRVALSTDFNPGTSYSENIQLMVALGCGELRLSVEESILAVTREAAAAVREPNAGVISPGAKCDLLVLDSDSEVDLAYHYGVNLTHTVVKRGEVAYVRR